MMQRFDFIKILGRDLIIPHLRKILIIANLLRDLKTDINKITQEVGSYLKKIYHGKSQRICKKLDFVVRFVLGAEPQHPVGPDDNSHLTKPSFSGICHFKVPTFRPQFPTQRLLSLVMWRRL